MVTISASEARQSLPAQLDRVEAGEEVAISRHGRVVAVLTNPQSVRSARTRDAWKRADRVGRMLEESQQKALPEPSITPERAAALITEARQNRSAR